MRLPFLDRREELARLRTLLADRERGLAVLYGRRRCGKSRLLLEALKSSRSAYYVGDDREGAVQRAAVATAIGRLLPGFDKVTYPDWDALLGRWYSEAPPKGVLVLDEFPSLVSAAPELASLLQKHVDQGPLKPVHLVLAGSSQRMMQGLVLDRSAPLFGRAREILRIDPLPAGWIQKALAEKDPVRAVEAYAVWGGVPRYWELAADHANLMDAVSALVLSPLGVLHDEPTGLLLDDLREIAQAASILSLIGSGIHRLSELAARLEKPATSLAHPMRRLLDLGMVGRETPHGTSPRDSKRTLYRISDPFLRFWFRFVEPNRSALETMPLERVAREVGRDLGQHVAGVWEDLARASVPRLRAFGYEWKPASRWWGPGLDRKPMEIDLVAESADGAAVLFGEVKWGVEVDPSHLLAALHRKAANWPFSSGRKPCFVAFLPSLRKRLGGLRVVTAAQVMRALL
ncbi:MAG: ATP-binding protein [Planctomycetota bacterium]